MTKALRLLTIIVLLSLTPLVSAYAAKKKSRISVRPLSCYCLNSGDQWGEQQKQICTISTVKEFWEAMNNIKPAFLLPVNSIYHLFKVWLSFPHQDYLSPV